MKTFLLFTVVLLCTFTTNANNYYFSSTSGDDARTTSQAHNSSTPWKSVNKLNSIFSSLLPGDSVLFKRGETFYGSITINKSGTASKPIVLGAYGSGARPIVTSFVTLSGWVANAQQSGVYDCAPNSALPATEAMVTMNNVEQGIGRYPNSGYLTFEKHSGNSITDNELNTSTNWNGSTLVVRTCHWIIDAVKITSHSGGTLTYSPSLTYNAKDGWGYFIQNNLKTLDKLGEWYYNSSAKKISMYFGSKGPSSYAVQAATLNTILVSSSKSYIVMDNITFKGANAEALKISGGTNIAVQNCDVMFAGTDGVVASSTNFILQNSTIQSINNDGVIVENSNKPIVKNNLIKNTSVIAGMGKSGNGNGAGVRTGSHSITEYNQIINSGYSGITFGGDYSIVNNNYIDSFCLVKDDASGIYTANESNRFHQGTQIENNIIMNGIGSIDGTDGHLSNSGIYMDDNTNGVTITGNTIANCDRGFYLHNSRNLIVKNNTLYNNTSSQLFMAHDNLGDPLRNHTITNNIFFAKFSTQLTSTINTKINDIGSVGRLDSNYYARPIDNNLTILNTTYLYSSSQVKKLHDLDSWKSAYSKDGSSKISAKQIAPYHVTGLIGNTKVANGDFAATNVKDLSGSNCTTSWENSGLLDGGYAKIVSSSASSSIVLKAGTLSTSKKYVLRFSIKGTSKMSVTAYLRGATTKQSCAVSTTRSENEMIFYPTANQSSGSLSFSPGAQGTYYIDNIKLYEVNVSKTNPDDSLKFVVNTSAVTKSFSLNGNFVDVKNNKFSNSIVLQPYSSAVLIKNGGGVTTTPVNEAPSVIITTPSDNDSFMPSNSVTIDVNANDADGSVSKVDFYNGSSLLGSDNTSPYSFTWDNVAAGNYTITAKATDNDNAATTSVPVAISVSNSKNAAPTVGITSPSNNANFTSSASLKIDATAADADGSVNKVDFYNGSTLLGSDNTSPYSFTWDNVAAGNYTITAKATDNSNAVTTSNDVSVSVGSPNSNGAPTVSITSPQDGQNVSGPATINMSATANDEDGTISKVEFYNNGTLLHTENYTPYTYDWQNVPAGNYTITAKAIDNKGFATTSSGILVTVTGAGDKAVNNAPIINITNPRVNQSFTGTTDIYMSATASDKDGKISKVQFYNGSTLLHTETVSPYGYSWQNVHAGTYKITMKATDNNGLSTSSSVTVTVKKASNSAARPVVDTLANIAEVQQKMIPNNLDKVVIKVGPNPATNVVSVYTNGLPMNKDLKISVLSVTGAVLKTIQTNTSNQVVQVNVSTLTNGIYIMQVASGDLKVNKQFIKN